MAGQMVILCGTFVLHASVPTSRPARRPRTRRTDLDDASMHANKPTGAGAPNEYRPFTSCSCVCSCCEARFWYEERLNSSMRTSAPLYHRCCIGGRVRLFFPQQYPQYIQDLFSNQHFLDNIRPYSQMFAITSLGENIDDSVNFSVILFGINWSWCSRSAVCIRYLVTHILIRIGIRKTELQDVHGLEKLATEELCHWNRVRNWSLSQICGLLATWKVTLAGGTPLRLVHTRLKELFNPSVGLFSQCPIMEEIRRRDEIKNDKSIKGLLKMLLGTSLQRG